MFYQTNHMQAVERAENTDVRFNFHLAHGIKQFDSSFAWQQSVIEHVQIEPRAGSGAVSE